MSDNGKTIDSYDGLDLWREVEETDVRYTKSFDRGNFKGTAVDAVYNLRRLTEYLGPVGAGWGWTVVSDRLDTFGIGEDQTVLHSLTLRVWFRRSNGEIGHVESLGHTKAAYWTRAKRPGEKPRFIVDDEVGKKSLTDALSKVMMWLGASADIWMGRFDSNRYVPVGGREESPAGNGQASDSDAKLIEHARSVLDDLRAADTAEDLRAAAIRVKGTFADKPFWPMLVNTDRDLAGEIQQLVRSKAKAHEIDLTKV